MLLIVALVEGKLGCLALFWENDVNLHVLDSNKNYVDFYFVANNNIDNNDYIWRGTSIYGCPKKEKKNPHL